MERPLARPHEVPRIGLLQTGIAGLGESKPLLRTLAPSPVHRDGGHELQIVGLEPEDPQEPGEAREVAVDDLLQVRHPCATPVRRSDLKCSLKRLGTYRVALRRGAQRLLCPDTVQRPVSQGRHKRSRVWRAICSKSVSGLSSSALVSRHV